VAGVLSSTNEDCSGMAPDAEIYILKLFTDDDVTYSSWFIDAFNFVLDNNIDIVNLSTASKDSDLPFTEKINELTAAGVIIVSAIGNDGPT
jgi:membrane-bound transcription factor site-1 protease